MDAKPGNFSVGLPASGLLHRSFSHKKADCGEALVPVESPYLQAERKTAPNY
jgi:hypothetical protein